jgi:hypothetical protein
VKFQKIMYVKTGTIIALDVKKLAREFVKIVT